MVTIRNAMNAFILPQVINRINETIQPSIISSVI
jgi:hypothetical protein